MTERGKAGASSSALVSRAADTIKKLKQFDGPTDEEIACVVVMDILEGLAAWPQPDWTEGDLKTGKCWVGMIRRFAQANNLALSPN